MVRDENFFMQMALDMAWTYQGLTYPNPPVGAVITDSNFNFISIGIHTHAGGPHAEVNAIKNAYQQITHDETINTIEDSKQLHKYICKHHNDIFKDKYIYVTLEPCNHYGKTPACSELIVTLGFKKVFIGTEDLNIKASGGIEKLKNNGVHVTLGILEEKCKILIEPFLIWQKTPFVFFKLAMSSNGVIDGGTVTCKQSRTLVHALRSKIDLLIIGGNTVRLDRPKLDARHSGGRAPDVLIYSKRKDFDMTIPLFNIEERKVFIEDNFEKINEYRFVMIEGGESMLKEVKEFVSWFLFFRSPHFKDGYSPKLNLHLKEEFSMSIGEDRLSWFKKLDG